ncbi:MAG: beta-N-acetylhexosaminidase [Clostridia bacterium]|nr:beta-N-acetylhexosaminidase [Clostridia bacterium]
MNFTALFDEKKGTTYRYTKRGTTEAYLPDKVCEESALPQYDGSNGNLFARRPVIFGGSKLLDGGVDLSVSMGECRFVDRVALTLTEKSRLLKIEILMPEGGVLKPVAVKENPAAGELLVLPVGVFGADLTVRLSGDYADAGLAFVEIFVANGVENAVYPQPLEMAVREGALPLDGILTFTVFDEIARGGAAYLSERFAERFDKALAEGKGEGNITFSFADMEKDAYELTVNADGVSVKSGGVRGFFYAVDTLLQLVRDGEIPYLHIVDKPLLDMRGVHILLPARCDIPFLKRLVREILVPMRYNVVFLQLSGAMRYEKYPEINEKWLEACRRYAAGEWPKPAHYGSLGHDVLEKHEIADICAYIRSFGIEIVPEVQSLSHVQYITTAYPELAERQEKEKAEIDAYVADDRPEEFYAHDMCPQHPRYYEVIFGIIDEVVELIRPERFIHVGHDEAYGLAKCPVCSKIGGAKVYADEVTRLNEYVKSKGLTMMMWADMLQNKRYSVPEALSLVPRDVVLLDFTWYFDLDKDIEDKLLAKGHRVLMGNMYSSHYPRYESRIRKKGMLGAEVSTWIHCNEHHYAFEGKLYDLVYSANMMWSDAYDSAYRRTYNAIVMPRLWEIRERIGALPKGKTHALPLDGSVKNVPSDLLWQMPYERAVKLTSAQAEVEIPVGTCARMLTFTHTTDLAASRVMWQGAQKIGEYVLQYEDGTEYAYPLLYADNIMKYTYTYGAPYETVLFRHEGYGATYTAKPFAGKDKNGKDFTLLTCPVKNPHPEKRIVKIIARHMKNTDAAILLFEVARVD